MFGVTAGNLTRGDRRGARRHVDGDVLVLGNGSFGYSAAVTVSRHLCLLSFSSNPSPSAHFSLSHFHYVRPHLGRPVLDGIRPSVVLCRYFFHYVMLHTNDFTSDFRRSRYATLSVLPIPYAPVFSTTPMGPLVTGTVRFFRMSANSLGNRHVSRS